MKKTISAVLLVAASFLAGTTAAQAQSLSQRVNVPFQFNAAGKTYPPALYFIQYEPAANQVEVLGRDKKLLARMPVITRLGLKQGAANDGKVRLVFDQVGEQRFLSEVWFPGEDGLLVRSTTERHRHESIESGQE